MLGFLERLRSGDAVEEYQPRNIVDVRFKPSYVDDRVLISAHVDTIQALLLLLHTYRDTDLHVKGRVADTQAQKDEILDDPVVGFFIFNRAHERAPIIGPLVNGIGRPILRAHDRGDDTFDTKFYKGSELVADWEAGKLTPNHLLPVFGGLTELSLGSDEIDIDTLSNIGEELGSEVWDKQINGTSISAEERRIRVRTSSMLKKAMYTNIITYDNKYTDYINTKNFYKNSDNNY